MPKFVTAMFPLIISDGVPGFDQIERTELTRIINQHLEFILFTRKGEMISDVEFGVGLEDYIFMQHGEHLVRSLSSKIDSQIGKYLGYLTSYKTVVDLSQIDTNKITVKIKYAIDNLDVDEVADFIVGG